MNAVEPKTYTVESVTCGHPDKVCDQISDAILDTCLKQDPLSRVAVETFGSHGLLIVGGEVTASARVDFGSVAAAVYRRIGYPEGLKVFVHVARQSPDIAQGVDPGGAGDQGIMYGYATDETPEFLPRGIVLVHALARRLEEVRRTGAVPWLGPDGKTQVTMSEGRVRTVLVSAQHAEEVPYGELRETLVREVIEPVVGDLENVEVLVNPTGKFVRGGFAADAGLTGRKLMVDTYGGLVPHGGGCFSGKDATKVDRSGAYMCRFVAKNLVARGLARRCLVSVAYAIGRAEPLMVEAVNEEGVSLADLVAVNFDFRPAAIIERLGLRQPIFQETAAYGHFTNPDFPWEQVVEW